MQFAKLDLLVNRSRQSPVLCGSGDRTVKSTGELLGLAAQTYALGNEFGNGFRIKVDVGDGGEQAIDHETIDFLVLDAFRPGLVRPEGNALEGVDQQILQGSDIRLLAADADRGAAGSFGSLLTLVTKHGHYFPPILYRGLFNRRFSKLYVFLNNQAAVCCS